MAVTGAQCLASCVLTPGTIADGLLERPASSPATITIEHPTGSIDILAEYDLSDDGFTLISAGLIRTARKLADGNLYVPASIWGNEVQARQSEPKGVRV
jgi:2-methylaconitate cis-trans-isomerase PrpF